MLQPLLKDCSAPGISTDVATTYRLFFDRQHRQQYTLVRSLDLATLPRTRLIWPHVLRDIIFPLRRSEINLGFPMTDACLPCRSVILAPTDESQVSPSSSPYSNRRQRVVASKLASYLSTSMYWFITGFTRSINPRATPESCLVPELTYTSSSK